MFLSNHSFLHRSNKSWADLTDEAKLTRNEEKEHMQVKMFFFYGNNDDDDDVDNGCLIMMGMSVMIMIVAR